MQSPEFFNKIHNNGGLMQKIGAKEIDEDTKGILYFDFYHCNAV